MGIDNDIDNVDKAENGTEILSNVAVKIAALEAEVTIWFKVKIENNDISKNKMVEKDTSCVFTIIVDIEKVNLTNTTKRIEVNSVEIHVGQIPKNFPETGLNNKNQVEAENGTYLVVVKKGLV